MTIHRRDDAADEHARAAQRPEGAAEERDRAADERDRAAAERTISGDEQEARDRDEGSRDREQSAQDREHAEQRDRAAAERDNAAGERTIGGRDQAAQDRDEGSRDREQSSRDRKHAEERDRAAAERDGAAAERTAKEHELAAQTREGAARDREEAARDRARAGIDVLTGALRRGRGLVDLQREIDRARRSDGRLVLAFVDVDGLKAINDAGGHAAGDQLLRDVALALRANLRSYDLVVRYGGDEFLCALSGSDITDTQHRFDEVARNLTERIPKASVGVGLAALADPDTLSELIDRADFALYAGRRSSREPADA